MRSVRVRTADAVRMGVNVRVYVQDVRTGLWRAHDEGHNLVTDAGLNVMRDRLLPGTVAGLSHFAVGTGNTATAAGNTTLDTEVFRDVFTQVTVAPAARTIRYYLGPNDANGHTLREVGLFNAASGPTLFARRVMVTPINKDIDTAATFEWTISIGAV
jgi:hypothetical protein